MKFTSACGISFLMLFLLIIGSFFNAGYLNKTTSFIINELDALLADKNPSVGDVTDLRNFWEDRKRILKFTLPDSSLPSQFFSRKQSLRFKTKTSRTTKKRRHA